MSIDNHQLFAIMNENISPVDSIIVQPFQPARMNIKDPVCQLRIVPAPDAFVDVIFPGYTPMHETQWRE